MILLSSLLMLVAGATVVACVTAVACIQTVIGIPALAGVLLVHDGLLLLVSLHIGIFSEVPTSEHILINHLSVRAGVGCRT
jgi:hypothetical protein